MKRIAELDYLKVVGILCVILAHVNPPEIVFQLRNFDVVLLIAVSAFLFLSSEKTIRYREYFLKRIKRLLIPTYLFLIVFFSLSLLFQPDQYSKNQILNSFLLRRNSIGYVWIVQLYLVEAIILPPLKAVSIKWKNTTLLIMAFLLIGLQEVLCSIGFFNKVWFVGETLSYILPCISISLFAFFYKKSNGGVKYLPSIIFIILFAITAAVIAINTGLFYNTNIAKYPMRLYYLSYALGLTGIIVYLAKTKLIKKISASKIVRFIGSNSFWIYLWHILYLTVFNVVFPGLSWIVLYLSVLTSAVLTMVVQVKLVEKFFKKSLLSKYLIG